MVKMLVACVLAVFSCAATAAGAVAVAPETQRITSGSENGTYFWLASDLVKYVAKSSGLKLEVQTSSGSIQNVQRMFEDNKTLFGFVQSDVYQAYLDQAERRNPQAIRWIMPLRVVLPVHEEEVYFVVRADSPLQSLREIRNKRINIGSLNSGSAFTASSLYQLIFGASIADAASGTITTYTHEEALTKMVTDQSIDVAVIVGGQPAPLFVGMEPSVEKNFKLLKLDERDAGVQAAMKTYATGVIKAGSYPQWIKQDLAAFTVRTFLVTRDSERQQTQTNLAAFAKSLCNNLAILRREGHPKWRQVSLQLPPLGRGLRYHPMIEYELGQCAAPPVAAARPAPVPTPVPVPAPTPVPVPAPVPAPCTLSEKIIGLCAGR
jgi:uncharacterized protein